MRAVIQKSPFASRFDELIEKHEASYRKFARATNFTPAYVSQIMNGVRCPTEKIAKLASQFFRLNPKEAANLEYLASISQKKITIEARNYSEAEKIVQFATALRNGA